MNDLYRGLIKNIFLTFHDFKAYLDNEEELEHEGHVDVGITFPEVPDAQDVLAPDDVSGPQQAAKT